MEPINQKSHCQWILQVHKNILLFLETFHHPFECSFFFPLPPLTKHCDNLFPHAFSCKHWSLALIVYVCGGGRILGMYVCIFLFLTQCLFLSPVLFSVFNLWPEEKQRTQTIKKLFWKGFLKWHRTQGLMSNLSKPGINATAKTFGTAAALNKAVAPNSQLLPLWISGSGHVSWKLFWGPSLCQLCLASEGGTEPHYPAVAQRSVEMSSGLCLPVSEQECSFNHL